MTSTADWFTVDREGLAKLLERKGKEFILYELIQNSWDTNAKSVNVELIPNPHLRGYSILKVTDDHPDGWKNLTHAWTLFAESEKKADAEKRGRFNLGEKLVLSLCRSARIETTTGGVRFDETGRHAIRTKRTAGSMFWAEVRITEEERRVMRAAIAKLIPPPGIETVFNSVIVQARTPLRRIEATLPTEIADADGILRRSSRKTVVEVYAALEGETPSVYEMGIPVVETGDKWHYSVGQKVPLNSDRDNVTPAYLRELRTLVLNGMYQEVTKDDVTASWVRDASADPSAAPEAIETVMTHRFGEKRVIADQSDPEGTKLALSKGYTVVPGGALSGGEWANVKRDSVMLPAGQVTPSPKPYSPGGDLLKIVPLEKYTEGMRRVAGYSSEIGLELLGKAAHVTIVSDVAWPFSATFGPSGDLTFNLGRLGHEWFSRDGLLHVDELLLHEFAHNEESDHLSHRFHDAICRLGAKLVQIALDGSPIMKKYGR